MKCYTVFRIFISKFAIKIVWKLSEFLRRYLKDNYKDVIILVEAWLIDALKKLNKE